MDVPVKGVALVRVKHGTWERLKNKSHKIFNQTVSFYQAYAVWMPFSLPGSKVINHISMLLLYSILSVFSLPCMDRMML